MVQMIPQYNTKLFTDVWSNETDFLDDVKGSGLNKLSDSSLSVLFKLLYARYGNSPIANLDEEQFKFKIYSVIYQYGPTWEKKIEIQDIIRNLTEEEIRTGSKAIYNHSFNPSSEPSTSTLEELTTINDQNTTNYKKSKLEGYAMLWELLNTDITEAFIKRFKICFKQFVMPENPVLYITEE